MKAKKPSPFRPTRHRVLARCLKNGSITVRDGEYIGHTADHDVTVGREADPDALEAFLRRWPSPSNW
jgi:hypothetical protein